MLTDYPPAPQKPTSIEHLDYMQHLAIKEVQDILEHPETNVKEFMQELLLKIDESLTKKQENIIGECSGNMVSVKLFDDVDKQPEITRQGESNATRKSQ